MTRPSPALSTSPPPVLQVRNTKLVLVFLLITSTCLKIILLFSSFLILLLTACCYTRGFLAHLFLYLLPAPYSSQLLIVLSIFRSLHFVASKLGASKSRARSWARTPTPADGPHCPEGRVLWFAQRKGCSVLTSPGPAPFLLSPFCHSCPF